MSSVAQSLTMLRDLVSTQNPDAHMKLGADALPTPPSQLEVVDCEVSLEPTENPKSDFLAELLERDE